MNLADKHCVPCNDGMAAMNPSAARELLASLPGWTIENGRLTKSWTFPDFATALAYVNRVGAVAESEGHHPDVFLTWGKVRLELWTHAANGLTENDFILAAKADEMRGGGR